jgi:hypothetical protein
MLLKMDFLSSSDLIYERQPVRGLRYAENLTAHRAPHTVYRTPHTLNKQSRIVMCNITHILNFLVFFFVLYCVL